MYQYEDSGRHSEGEGAYFISSAKGISNRVLGKDGGGGKAVFRVEKQDIREKSADARRR